MRMGDERVYGIRALILVCFNFLGDGLRDLFDARQSR